MRTVTVSAEESPELHQTQGGDAYNGRYAAVISNRVKDAPADKQQIVFTLAWRELREATVPADAKAFIARELMAALKDNGAVWANAEGFTAYASADRARLKNAQGAIGSAPNHPALIGIDPNILQDMQATHNKIERGGGDVLSHPKSDTFGSTAKHTGAPKTDSSQKTVSPTNIALPNPSQSKGNSAAGGVVTLDKAGRKQQGPLPAISK